MTAIAGALLTWGSIDWIAVEAHVYRLQIGSKASGVDKVIWSTPNTKLKTVDLLKRRGYKSKPL